MSPKIATTPFSKDLIINKLNVIDSYYLKLNRFWFLLDVPRGYAELHLDSMKKRMSGEQKVLNWLQHIEGYFLIPRNARYEQQKSDAVRSILCFLKEFKHLPQPIQTYLSQDPHAQNCLVLTLMLSRNKDEVNSILSIMRVHIEEGMVWDIVEWLFKKFFEDPSLCVTHFWDQLIEKYKDTVEKVIPASTSPAVLVFRFLNLYRMYPRELKDAPMQPVASTPDKKDEKKWLEHMPFIIELGFACNEFTNALPLCSDYLKFWSKTFCESFLIEYQSQRDTYKIFYEPRFLIFLQGYLVHALAEFSDWNNKARLIGLSRLIRFYNPKPYTYAGLIIASGTKLCQHLIKQKEYAEAYKLYDDLLISWSEYETEDIKATRLGIYCYFYKINAWLLRVDKELFFDKEQEKFLNCLSKANELLPTEYGQYPFYKFAQRLVAHHNDEKDKGNQELCLSNYRRIIHLLTKDQQKEIDNMLNPQPKFTFNFGESWVIEPPNCRGEILVSRTHLYAFFSPDASDPLKTEFIHREQFPVALLAIMDKLFLKFPEAYFYLVGAASINILDGIKPNDYDFLAINVSLEHIEQYIKDEGISFEARSSRNPSLHCDLGDGVILEFSAKEMEENKTLEQVLINDFFQRDFNLNALYCRWTKDFKFPIFSFEQTMRQRANKIIASINNPGSIFQKDTTLFFRLIKLLIQFPNYKLNPDLQNAVGKMKSSWFLLFTNYVQNDANKKRFNHHIIKLFERYSYEAINRGLDRLGILEIISGNSLEEANKACLKIPRSLTTHKLLNWMSANVLHGYQLGRDHGRNFFQRFLILSEEERDYLNYVCNKGPGRNGYLKKLDLEFISFAQSFSTSADEHLNIFSI